MLPLQASEQTLSLLPMEVQVGDRFTAEEFEWEVVTHPASFHGGKSLRARIQRPGLPESDREITWPAHASRDSADSMTDRRLATLRVALGFLELPPRARAATAPPAARQVGWRRT